MLWRCIRLKASFCFEQVPGKICSTWWQIGASLWRFLGSKTNIAPFFFLPPIRSYRQVVNRLAHTREFWELKTNSRWWTMSALQCFDLKWPKFVCCIRKGLFRPDLRGERTVQLCRRSAPSCQKIQLERDLLWPESGFCSLVVDPEVAGVVFRCILLSESEGTLLASALPCPDVAALKEGGVAYCSVSRTVFK